MSNPVTPDTDIARVLPCPFCGSHGTLFASSSHSTAWEGGCSNLDRECPGRDVIWEKTKEAAIARWNDRPSDPTAEALEEAEKALREIEELETPSRYAHGNLAYAVGLARAYFARQTERAREGEGR